MDYRDERGFSLVEVLVVAAIMGLVMVAVFGLYQSTQRTTSAQDEVVEVQQNLRIAMEQIARDLRMAGFMVDPDIAPLTVANAGTVTLRTAAPFGIAARIDAGATPNPGSTPDVDFTVSSPAMAEMFDDGQIVRIVRPPNQGDLYGELTVDGDPSPGSDIITLTGFAAGDENTDVLPGDIIARTASGAFPNTVSYTRSGTNLHRLVNGASATDSTIVASKLENSSDGLVFSYLLEDGDEVSAPGTLGEVVAVRVTLTGQTAATLQGVKERSLTNVIKIRN